jgi:hypothetical protein
MGRATTPHQLPEGDGPGACSPPHPRAVQVALSRHQHSKLEHDGDTLFVVPRLARDLDDVEQVEFGELI